MTEKERLQSISGHGLYAGPCPPECNQGRNREISRSGSDRHRLVRRHPRRDAVALRAVRQAAHLRDQAGPAGRSEGADQASDRDARLPGHRQERQHHGRLYLDDAGIEPLPDRARLPQGRQERAAGEADLTRTVGGRRADRAGEPKRPEVHHRLFAALQHQDRVRQEKDRRRHARQSGVRAGEPQHHPHARHQDRQARSAVARW